MSITITLRHYAVLLLTLSVHAMPASCSMIDDFKAACPYSDFCTVNRSLEITPTSSRGSCCQGCFCDEKCGLFGDCCPDYAGDRLNRGAAQQLDCKELVVENAYSKEARYPYQLKSYRVIDFCPIDNNNEKCAGNPDRVPDIDDMVVVSDKKTGTPYKNIHCAQCHGVSDVVRWQLGVIRQRVPLETVPMLASEVNQHLYNNCMVVSVPGEDIPLTARSTHCNYDARCPENGADTNVVNGCINGPIMPFYYGYLTNGKPRVYKNAMCYKCSAGEDVPSSCNIVDGSNFKTSEDSVLVLLNVVKDVDESARISANNLCNDFEKFDEFRKSCRRLYCPPLEAISSGKCVRIGEPGVVKISLIFVPTDEGRKPARFSRYNQTMAFHYFNYTNKILNNKHCNFQSFVVSVVFDKVSRIVEYITVDFKYEIVDTCTKGYITKLLNKVTSFNITWLTNDGESIKTKGRVIFIKFDPLDYNNPRFDRSLLIHLTLDGIPDRSTLIKDFFLCPYYVLELEEYINLIPLSDREIVMKGNGKFTAFTETLHGFYPLSEYHVAVCVQTYVDYLSSGGFSTCCMVPGFILTLIYVLIRNL